MKRTAVATVVEVQRIIDHCAKEYAGFRKMPQVFKDAVQRHIYNLADSKYSAGYEQCEKDMKEKRSVVYNYSYGGFHLTDEAVEWLKRHGLEMDEFAHDIERHNPILVACVKQLGEKAGKTLRIIELEPYEKYYITEFDGWESVHTSDRYI